MEPIAPQVMVRQVEELANDLRESTPAFDRRARGLLTPPEWTSVRKVYLTGDGDSYHASCAAEMAFETIAGVACEPMSALRFLEYASPWMHELHSEQVVVIATSASGTTPRVLQAIERGREHGALTVAVTGTPDSAVTRAADRVLEVEVPRRERSPGIRTYQASLLGLLLVAILMGEARGRCLPEEANDLRRELVALADAMDATNAAIAAPCRELADAIGDAPAMSMVGSGPSYGTALFSAAKMVEAAGVMAVAQDLEEWWHVERFARPTDMPLFVIAPPGRSRWRAGELAAAARGLGRRVIAVTHRADADVAPHAHFVLSVHGDVREELSALLYHLFASRVASHVAERLGRVPFQLDRPPLPDGVA
jgi:glucosamine--fructose-6-phosphate aminotransferase (isomerizing)